MIYSNSGTTRVKETAGISRRGSLSDTRDFETWALPHRDALRRQAWRLTGSAADADDLVQETLIRGFTRRDQVDNRATVGAWLATILRNQFINERRRSAARPRVVDMSSLGTFANAVAAVPATDDGATEDTVINRWEVEAILKAVDKLTPELRQALLLCDVEGCSYEEIAEITRIPLGTVRSRLFRARATVRRLLPAVYRQMTTAAAALPVKSVGRIACAA